MKLILICLISLIFSGCALMPDSLRPEFQHMSHITQHWPLVNRMAATNYGVETVELMAHWDIRRVAYVEVGEGIALDRKYGCASYASYGEIEGPREQFIARVGLIIPLK